MSHHQINLRNKMNTTIVNLLRGAAHGLVSMLLDPQLCCTPEE